MENQELIESYLEGLMSDSEMRSFEAKLQQDPLLRKEFDIQNDIITEIKETRKAELKARLNRIDVSSLNNSGSLSTGQIIGGVVIVSGLAIGAYFLLDSKKQDQIESPSQEQMIPQEDEPIEKFIEEPDTDPELTDETKQETINEEADKGSLGRDTQVPDKTVKDQTSEVEPEEDKINDLVAPDVVEDIDNLETEMADPDVTIPDINLDEAVSSTSSSIEIETRSRKRYDFHYKFENNRLILYGDFSEEPYELIELKNDEGILLFLAYKNEFYYLDNDASIVTPLEAVKNKQIIMKLSQRTE